MFGLLFVPGRIKAHLMQAFGRNQPLFSASFQGVVSDEFVAAAFGTGIGLCLIVREEKSGRSPS